MGARLFVFLDGEGLGDLGRLPCGVSLLLLLVLLLGHQLAVAAVPFSRRRLGVLGSPTNFKIWAF